MCKIVHYLYIILFYQENYRSTAHKLHAKNIKVTFLNNINNKNIKICIKK